MQTEALIQTATKVQGWYPGEQGAPGERVWPRRELHQPLWTLCLGTPGPVPISAWATTDWGSALPTGSKTQAQEWSKEEQVARRGRAESGQAPTSAPPCALWPSPALRAIPHPVLAQAGRQGNTWPCQHPPARGNRAGQAPRESQQQSSGSSSQAWKPGGISPNPLQVSAAPLRWKALGASHNPLSPPGSTAPTQKAAAIAGLSLAREICGYGQTKGQRTQSQAEARGPAAA